MMFFVFVLLAFSCKDLFAYGFWNTYNCTWSSVKSLYTEKLLTDKMILVDYEFSINNNGYKGKGILINATEAEVILFDSKKGFLKVERNDRIIHLIPNRTPKNLIFKEERFTNISLLN